MPRFRVVTKHQISGWRFLLRRIEHALLRRDASMVDDPQRGRSTALSVGIALTCVIIAGSAVLAFFKPAKQVGDSPIISEQGSGALFVHVDSKDSRLYPALNLASARLITGSAANPVPVTKEELAKYPRGPVVGIPGAPGVMSDTGSRDSSWAVCDTARLGAAAPIDSKTGLPAAGANVFSTVVGGPLTVGQGGDSPISPMTDNQARLLSEGGETWLVYLAGDRGVVRAKIDLHDSAVTLALGIDPTATVAEASKGLIDAIPEAPPLQVPNVPGAGQPEILTGGATAQIGSVVTAASPGRPAAYYLVSRSGLVQVGSVLAAMIRNSNSRGAVASMTVGPDVVARNLHAGSWPGTAAYPARPVALADPNDRAVTCYHWSRGATDNNAVTQVLIGRKLPLTTSEQSGIVPLVTAPSSHGATADTAYMPRTTGRFVQLTGTNTNSPLRESLFWVSDSGVRYGIDTSPEGDDQTLSSLGLTAQPIPAPWSIISLFAVGPTLSQRDARIEHDGVAPDRAAVGIPDKNSGGTS
ncbi:MAG: type VII secretion protein EccB [Nocardia sp.]|nr:type VII secretion protein EccB [Nocardia sp.]